MLCVPDEWLAEDEKNSKYTLPDLGRHANVLNLVLSHEIVCSWFHFHLVAI